jgi:hypothetical protein
MTTKTSKTTVPEKNKAKKDETPYVPPKKLSKMALWRRANPEGAIEIVDMRAVMK